MVCLLTRSALGNTRNGVAIAHSNHVARVYNVGGVGAITNVRASSVGAVNAHAIRGGTGNIARANANGICFNSGNDGLFASVLLRCVGANMVRAFSVAVAGGSPATDINSRIVNCCNYVLANRVPLSVLGSSRTVLGCSFGFDCAGMGHLGTFSSPIGLNG